MGIDFGSKRIGIALSDELLLTAQGRDSIYHKDTKSDLDRIALLVRENGVTEIIVGLPLMFMFATSSAALGKALPAPQLELLQLADDVDVHV